jgi:PAS domain S-box-containing protein
MSYDEPREDPAGLRKRAEELTRTDKPQSLEPMSSDEAVRALQELRVYQIELQMQNEELRRAQVELDATRARYFDLYDLAPVGYFTLSESGLILEANFTAARLLGMERGTLVKRRLASFLVREDADIYYLRLRELRETGLQQDFEVRMTRPDGTPFWVRVEAVKGEDAVGAQVFRAVISNITERKRAEEELRQSEAELDLIYQNAPFMMLLVDEECRIRKANKFTERFTGVSEADLIGKRAGEALRCLYSLEHAEGCGSGPHCETCTVRLTVLDTMATGKSHQQVEASLPIAVAEEPQQATFLLSTAGFKFRGKLQVLATIQDITERKRTEEAYHQLSAIVESSDDAIIGKTIEGVITSWNQGAARLYGYSRVEMVGQPIAVLIPMDHLDEGPEILRRIANGDRIEQYETLRRKKDGSLVDVLLKISPIFDGLGNVVGASTIARDISDRKRAELQIQESRLLLEKFIEHAPASMAMFDRNMCYLLATNQWLRDCGVEREAILGKSHYEVIPDLLEHWKEAHRRGLAGEVLGAEEIWGMLDGSPRTISWEIHPWGASGTGAGGIIIIMQDISARKRAEQALLHSEKLASVGRMAATVAHEINNPLAAVSNLLFLTHSVNDLPESARQYLELADAELKRVAHITRQSLGFYREITVPTRTSVSTVLESVVDLLQSRIEAKQAVIEKQWDENLEITAVAGELRQVFSNLLANSLEAIDQKGVVTLRSSIGVVLKDGRRCIRVTVADNGKGIVANSRQRLFEPFFTTKGAIGTGLGLWVSKQIIDKHGGTIRMRSSTDGPRRGTVFSVVLPVEPAAAVSSQAAGS